MVPKTERFELRIESELLERVDQWRAKQEISRAEAIRQLLEAGLTEEKGSRIPQLTDGDKLIVALLADVSKHLKVKGETDVDFVQQAIYGGHYWALGWQMQGLFHGHTDTQTQVRFVSDVLDMWYFIEEAVASFTTADKARLKKEAEPFGEYAEFPGFDGNNETDYMGIARFFTDKMRRFESLKGRSGRNSHVPMAGTYRRMLQLFLPMRKTLIGRNLSVNQVIALMKARVHPEQR